MSPEVSPLTGQSLQKLDADLRLRGEFCIGYYVFCTVYFINITMSKD